jgi:hypothetical protein
MIPTAFHVCWVPSYLIHTVFLAIYIRFVYHCVKCLHRVTIIVTCNVTSLTFGVNVVCYYTYFYARRRLYPLLREEFLPKPAFGIVPVLLRLVYQVWLRFIISSVRATLAVLVTPVFKFSYPTAGADYGRVCLYGGCWDPKVPIYLVFRHALAQAPSFPYAGAK